MRLIYEATGKEVIPGDKAKTFRGEKVEVVSIEKPRHAGSTGRVNVEFEKGEPTTSFYPSVIGAKWIEREDQQ